VPNGSLALVPFAALPAGDTTSAGAVLGSRYAIRYAPSLAFLARPVGDARARERRARVTDALVVGDPIMPRADAGGSGLLLARLPNAALEARQVAGRIHAVALGGAAATEGAVRRRIGRAAIVHLATHGYAYSSDARARDSFIALAPDSAHDGLLTVGEILDELGPITADLVVLSACQTGLGDLKQAEGTVGLQRAFLARGARSVLVSLWSVDDAATRRLMDRFYGHWLNDADRPTKAEALRRAQEDVRRTKGLEHPRYWAAFQLVGAP
jgi:CHAT domain-containing protein